MLSRCRGRHAYRYILFVLPFLLLFWQEPHALQRVARVPITTVTISRSNPEGVSNFSTGVTHTQSDIDGEMALPAVRSAAQLMQSSVTYQNQHIMGWGAENPEPMPGVYNWDSLDARVQLMRRTDGHKVLTLCCAPGWMRPAGYQNDWDDLETAPAANHVQDFANLAQAVALRYSDVKYFQVWNELKGMWSDSPGATSGIKRSNVWDYQRYTTLYNAVYDAIKQVRPEARVGGPYVDMTSYGNASDMSDPGPSYSWGTLDQRCLDVISYWLINKHGADFIAIDGSSSNQDGVWLTDPFSAGKKFMDVYNWIRTQPEGGSTLPIWWSEWYAGYPSSQSKNLDYYNALMASDEIYTLQSYAAVALIWQPQGDARGYAAPEGIWTDTASASGGKATPYWSIVNAFHNYFMPGTVFYQTTVSTSFITVLAGSSKTLLVNRRPTAQKVIVNDFAYYLNPYQVMLIDTV